MATDPVGPLPARVARVVCDTRCGVEPDEACFDLVLNWDGYHKRAAPGCKSVYTGNFLRGRAIIRRKFSLDCDARLYVFCPSQKYLHLLWLRKGLKEVPGPSAAAAVSTSQLRFRCG
jgi:hypothetical protein